MTQIGADFLLREALNSVGVGDFVCSREEDFKKDDYDS